MFTFRVVLARWTDGIERGLSSATPTTSFLYVWINRIYQVFGGDLSLLRLNLSAVASHGTYSLQHLKLFSCSIESIPPRHSTSAKCWVAAARTSVNASKSPNVA